MGYWTIHRTAVAWVLAITCGLAWAAPITYQGRLDDAGGPAEGVYDMLFEVYNDPTAGGIQAAASVSGVQVEDGLFTVEIDFGPDPLPADARWLAITVDDPDDGEPAVTLSPRQFLAAAPFAARDLNEPWRLNDSGSLIFNPPGSPDRSVLFNRDTRITSAEYFGFGADTAGFAGMYISTTGDNGDPFYGYSAGGDVDAYSYFDGGTGSLRFNIDGIDRLAIGPAGTDLIGSLETEGLAVGLGNTNTLQVVPGNDFVQIGENNGDTNIDMVGAVNVFGTVFANDLQYTSSETRRVIVMGTDLVPEVAIDNAVTHFSSSHLTTGTGNVTLQAQVDLPVGAEITVMRAYLNDGRTDKGLQIDLLRRGLTDAVGDLPSLESRITTTPSETVGLSSPQATFASAVVQDGEAYIVEVEAIGGWVDTSLLAVRAIEITYRVTRPD